MKITIEVSKSEYRELEKTARYLHCTVERATEALLQGQAASYNGDQRNDCWFDLIKYLRKIHAHGKPDANAETMNRLHLISDYLAASCDVSKMRQHLRNEVNIGQFESFKAYRAFVEGRTDLVKFHEKEELRRNKWQGL